MLKTFMFLAGHPLSRSNPFGAFARFAKWQLQSRLQETVEVPWIEGTKLVAKRGMTGATGNIYCGLHEFPEMALLLHLLRPDDLFIDVGANIGSYTILASGVIGANTIAAEPDPSTMTALQRNISANCIENRVSAIQAAVAEAPGKLQFSVGLDTTNHIVAHKDECSQQVDVLTLDQICEHRSPVFIKMDVEGYEDHVLAGAVETMKSQSLVGIATESVAPAVIRTLISEEFQQFYYDPFKRVLSTTKQYAHANALFLRNLDWVRSRISAAPSRMVFGTQL